jgi:hypothetical protein
MSLPPLASQDDLEAALERTISPATAALALRRASARVRKYCRQELTFHSADTITVPGGGRLLRLPQMPVVVDADNPLTVTELFGITNVEFTCLEGRDFTRLGSELTRADAFWAQTRLMGFPWYRPQGIWADRVRITYSHGYTAVPDDLLDVVLDLATMSVTNPQALRAETIDDYSRTFAAETIGAGTLSKEHKDALKPYRRSAFTLAPQQ